MKSEKNIERDLAWEFVQETHCPLFLTGRAGTGKTTFLHELQKKSAKRVVVVAPTGVAAINAGGVTIHSLFQLSFAPFVPGTQIQRGKFRLSKEKINLLKSIDLLVIDEISMVRADLLDAIDAVLRKFRENEAPFGGVQLVMIGDLQQLSPVVTNSDRNLIEEYYQTPYFFSSHALQRQDIAYIELQQVYRQSDPEFIQLLNEIRENRLAKSRLISLNQRYQIEKQIPNGCITLCSHNQRADAINQKKLEELAAPIQQFTAEVVDQFPESASPAPLDLQLRVGAQVMFLRNDPSADKLFFNGKIGKVTSIGEEEICVKSPGDREEVKVKRAVWEHMEYSLNNETGEIHEKKLGSFSQFPLKLAWAITIHKSQGLSFDQVAVDGEAAFAPGQIYVALSRCRSLTGLYLASPIVASSLRCDNRVLSYTKSMQSTNSLATRLAHEKIRYQQRLVLECFNYQEFGILLKRFCHTLQKNRALIQYPSQLEPDSLLEKSNKEICEVGENFARQLHRLFPEEQLPFEDSTIVERYQKASCYFIGKIAPLLQTLIEAEIISDNSEIKKRVETLQKKITLELQIKLAAASSCQEAFEVEKYLRAISQASCAPNKRKKGKTPSYEESDLAHPRCFQLLRQWRNQKAKEEHLAPFQVMHQRALVQVAGALPQSSTELISLKGIGPKIVEKYGPEILERVKSYCQEEKLAPNQLSITAPSDKKEKGASAALTLQRFKAGEKIEEIAKSRGLATTTIEGHLCDAIAKGELGIERILSKEKQQELTTLLLACTSQKLSEIKKELGEAYSYREISAVQAHLKNIQQTVFGKK